MRTGDELTYVLLTSPGGLISYLSFRFRFSRNLQFGGSFARDIVHYENIAVRPVYDIIRSGSEDSVPTAITVISKHNEVGVHGASCCQNSLPRLNDLFDSELARHIGGEGTQNVHLLHRLLRKVRWEVDGVLHPCRRKSGVTRIARYKTMLPRSART